MARKVNKTGKSKGEARHLRLYHWEMETAAWETLDPFGRCVLIEIMRRHNGGNNGKIPYSIREAAKALQIGKSTAARAFARLEERGFIVPEVKGAFDWKARHSTRWRLTALSVEETGELPSKEFARWQPGMSFSVPVAGPRAAAKVQKPVPVAGPNGTCSGTLGTCSGTEDAENGPDGTCSGTVKGQNGGVSVPVAGQSIVTRGCELESTAPYTQQKRLRSAPPQGAVASKRASSPSKSYPHAARSGALRDVP